MHFPRSARRRALTALAVLASYAALPPFALAQDGGGVIEGGGGFAAATKTAQSFTSTFTQNPTIWVGALLVIAVIIYGFTQRIGLTIAAVLAGVVLGNIDGFSGEIAGLSS